jgi:Crp-like helix-turn-helix domain
MSHISIVRDESPEDDRSPRQDQRAKTELEGQHTERNRLLRRLSPDSYAELAPQLESMRVGIRHPVWEPNEPLRFAYFPRGCVVSLVINFNEGRAVEAATIGREGVAGAQLALGSESTSTLAFGQVPGDSARISAGNFRQAMAHDGGLSSLVLLYAQSLQEQTAQSAACNRKHVTVERCARWLLMTHDRVGADQFALTQEFLAMMLGVRRASVSVAAESLKRARLINYSRGKITVLDRAGLEAAACECYQVVKQRHDQLLGPAA